MPFITTRTNRSISREQEQQLKSHLGRAIELVPGKSEQYLMLCFESDSHLWLRGDDSQSIVYIEAAIWGNEAHLGYDKFTAEVTRIFNEVLGIRPDCIYIRYSDIPDWGVAGMNFDRNKYL
jgi:phenylpyruvate tautomerase PptA (4-oxalocrotonate tautomerase family)